MKVIHRDREYLATQKLSLPCLQVYTRRAEARSSDVCIAGIVYPIPVIQFLSALSNEKFTLRDRVDTSSVTAEKLRVAHFCASAVCDFDGVI